MLRAAVTLYDALLGFALLFAPWSRIWQENWLFWNAGSLQPFLMSGPVRGAVSGLGAAFLIRAMGRLAGFSLVEEDAATGEARKDLAGAHASDIPANEDGAPPRAPLVQALEALDDPAAVESARVRGEVRAGDAP